MKWRQWLAPVLILIALGLMASGSYVLYPWQGALVTGLAGGPEVVLGSGWHWHLPGLTGLTRFDRRRQVFVSTPLDWTVAPQKVLRLRVLALWRISNPVQYLAALKASPQAAQARIVAAVRARLKVGRLSAREASTPWSRPPRLSTWLPAINHALTLEGIRLSRLECASLRWSGARMKSLGQNALGRWTTAENTLRVQTRLKLDRVRARAEARLAALRLLETERSAVIVSAGLQKATAIEAQARRLDPRFYDFYTELRLYARTLKAGKGLLLLSPNNPWLRGGGVHAIRH